VQRALAALKNGPRRVDDPFVTCPVSDCTYLHAPRWLGRRAAQQAADTELLVPLVGHIRDMIRFGGDDQPIARELNMSSDEVSRFWAVGRVYVKGMHALAHRDRRTRTYVPSFSELSQWRYIATRMTSLLADFDTDWYHRFWSGTLVTCERVPSRVKRQLRVTGVL
jgi:hypothetical protein